MVNDQGRPATAPGLDVNEVKDGLIVYDSVSDRVHYLNATAAVVFTLCDGERDPAAIAAVVAEAFGMDAPPHAEVDECLGQLGKEGLLR